MVDNVLKILLFLSPLVYSLKMPLNFFDIAFFRFGIIGLFIASLFDIKKREIKSIRKPIALLLAFGLFHLFIHDFRANVSSAYINLFLACVGIFIISEYISDCQKITKYIVYASSFNVIVWLAQLAGYSPIFNTLSKNWSGGLMENVTVLFTYLAIILPFVFVYSIPLFCLYIILSLISGQYIMLPIMLLLLFIKFRKPYQTFFLMVLGLSIIMLLHKHIITSIFMRWNYAWKPTIDSIIQQPLLGFGMGSYPNNLPGDNACNSYLQAIFGMGIGIIAWFVYIGKKLKNSFDETIPSIALISLAIVSFVEYPFEIPRLWFTIIFIIAIFIKEKEAVICG